MFQNFTVRGGPAIGRKNLPLLRAELATQALAAFFIPHEDEYQNEYLPDANERLAWASGFTGSAGSAFVLSDRAMLFVDGRYTLQAADQVDPDLFGVTTVAQGGPEGGAFAWLAAQSELAGQRIGYDPRLMSPNDVAALKAVIADLKAEAVPTDTNPVDLAWADRPPQPQGKVSAHPITFAGQESADKRADMGRQIAARGAAAVLLTSPASLAWTFNIRGSDVAHTPLPLGRALVHADGRATLFIDEAKLDAEVRAHLGPDVAIRPLDEIDSVFASLKGRTVSLDPALAPAWFFDLAEASGCQILRMADPAALPRAKKNAAEIDGMARAHQRDGVALSRYLHWLETVGQSGEITEIEAVEKLENLRRETNGLRDISFETISGAGPNGAIVHYRVSTATNRKLERGSLFLVDSGGQYLDGTTDVTRTVAIGQASPDMKRHYTLVLKGHIALSVVRFPAGTTGTHLDILARHALWQAGFDYAHGTGHGVGAYLGVHEGPQRISKALNAVPLAPGMVVSNEPGYYRTGAYGIRIENLQYVTPPAAIEGGEIEMLGFETLTLAPLDRRLIDTGLLSTGERDWVNAYHARVLAELGPRLDGEERAWLGEACAPL